VASEHPQPTRTPSEVTAEPMSAVPHSTAHTASPLTTGVGRYLKRGLDICLSLPVVVILLPPAAALTWLAHRLQSPGPLLFRQERCGLRGRRFTILKFRTMNPERSDGSSETQSRIFPMGNILRKTKIDEIPQFVNTLIGTMSIVGPRPHHFADCEQFEKEVEEYSLRTVAKPWITGLAQYKEYRGDFEWNCVSNRVQRDLAYIREWSLLLDLRLIVKTANVIRRKCWQAAIHKVERLPVVEKAGPRLGIFSPFSSSARPTEEADTLSKDGDIARGVSPTEPEAGGSDDTKKAA